MRKKVSFFKIAKILILAPIALYLIGVFVFFLYTLVELGPLQAILVTNNLLVSGRIHRALEPVTNDSELIKRFHAQRPVLEKLISIHEEKCFIEKNLNTFSYHEYPEVTALRQQIHLIAVKDEGELWFPDPYSKQAQERRLEAFQEESRIIQEAPRILNSGENIPHLTGVEKKLEQARQNECRYQTAKFTAETFPAHWMSKGWIYFPVDPKIENNELLFPNPRDWSKPISDGNVLPSLDSVYKQFFPIRSCSYRKIEPRWFLFVCPGH